MLPDKTKEDYEKGVAIQQSSSKQVNRLSKKKES